MFRTNAVCQKWYALIACCLTVCGCEQQMSRQASYRPLQPSAFFPNNMSARPLVPGTMPREHLQKDASYYTGKLGKSTLATQTTGVIALAATSPYAALAISRVGGPYVEHLPMPLTEKVLLRGQERFEVYCAMCHGYTGEGNGMVVQRGFSKPPSLHDPRLLKAEPGYIFEVITKGYGAMPSYSYMIPAKDRWNIAAYVQALQLSQNTQLDALTKEQKSKLQGAKKK